MRIIILTHNYPISPSERRNAGIFVHDFAKELAKANSVEVVCPGSFNRKVKFDSVSVYFFSWRGGKHLGKLRFWNPLDLFYGLNLLFRGIKTLSTVVKEARPDFTLAMWAIPGGFFAYITKAMFGIPYAIWVLGSDFYVYARIPIIGFFIRYVLKNAKYTFADGICLSAEVSRITGRKCLFLPSSTNFNLPKAKQATKAYRDKIVLTFIGRMEAIKGPDLLVDAILKLKSDITNFRFNFIGAGSLLPVLRERAKKGGIKNYVKFYGNVNDKRKIIGILNNSQWLVIPSRSDSTPLVFSEAMKAGIPVIVSELPDLKYFIDKYKVGLYFKQGDRADLTTILAGLQSNVYKRENFSRNTAKVASIFNLQNSARKFLKVVAV